MDLNNLEGVSSWINNLTGGAGIEGLGDIGKLTGLLGSRGGGLGFGRRFPIILILLLLVLFGNRGGVSNCNYPQQYACCCYKRKHRKHHRRRCCCCDGQGQFGFGGQFGQGGFGGSSNIIFIIIILLLIRTGRRDCEMPTTDTCDIFNFNADDVRGTEDQDVDFTVANEEE